MLSYLGMVGFSLIGLVLSRVAHIEAGAVARISGLAVLALGAACVGWMIDRPWRTLAAMAWATAAELMGVTTGFPFGPYRYTGEWWPSIGTFPVGLPLAWLLVAGGCWLVVGGQGWKRAVGVGLAAALVDVGLEELMVHSLRYWEWRGGGPVFGAPLANSIGWFAVAFGFSLVLGDRDIAFRRPAALVLGAYFLLMSLVAALDFRPSLPVWVVLTGVFLTLASGKPWRGTT